MSGYVLSPPPIDRAGHIVGPSPLSPAWPKAPPLEPPSDAFMGRVGQLEAVRRRCYSALAEPQTLFLLGRAERRALDRALSRLRTANVLLPHNLRNPTALRRPEPTLPDSALFGPRDLLPLLDTAIAVARTASLWHQRRRS